MRFRHFKLKNILSIMVTVLLFVLPACGGGGGDSITSTYITWSGSANGEYVVDATGDMVRFEAGTGDMVFGSTRYTNIYVSGSTLYFNGSKFGAVTYIQATNGSTIVGLICNNGYYADISGTESNLIIVCSSVLPVLRAPQDTGNEQKTDRASELQSITTTQRAASPEELNLPDTQQGGIR